MKLVSGWNSRNEPCCNNMRKALLDDEPVNVPGTNRPMVVGIYTGCDDYTLRMRPEPFLKGDKHGDPLEACPWCGEKVESCFAGSEDDHPGTLKLIGENPERDCDICTRGADHMPEVNNPAVFKRVIGSNRMQLCPRHYDAFEAWFNVNSRMLTPNGIGRRVWLPAEGKA